MENSPRGLRQYFDFLCRCCSKRLNSSLDDDVLCQDCFKEIDEGSVHDIRKIFWVHFSFLMDCKNSKFIVSILDDHYFKCSCSDSLLYSLGDIKKALIHFKECHSFHNGSQNDFQSLNLNELVASSLYSFFVLEDYDLDQLNGEVGRILEDDVVA